MVKVEDTDLDQTVIVVTHPRAKRGSGQPSHVHVLTNALGLEAPNNAVEGSATRPNPSNPVPPQHESGEPRGRIWLLDQHPWIHVGMSRRENPSRLRLGVTQRPKYK